MNKKYTLYLSFLMISVVIPLFIFQYAKTLSFSFFLLISIFSTLFLGTLLLIGDMFWMLANRDENPIKGSKLIKTEIKNAVIKNKRNIHDKFEAPLFLLPMNIVFYMFAKTLERDNHLYYLDIQIGNELKTIKVSESTYNTVNINDSVQVNEKTHDEYYRLTFFEMLLSGEMNEKIVGSYKDYSLSYI